MLRLFLAWALALAFCTETLAVPIPTHSTSRVILGWKGLASGHKLKPIVSIGGELGKVLYIADGTDLARSFAARGTHVCEITADANAWHKISKVWVSQAQIRSHSGDRMATLYPGAVLFASHTAAALGEHEDQAPWQMGIRQGDIGRLNLHGECYKKSDERVRPGLKLDYSALGTPDLWNIQQQPERGP